MQVRFLERIGRIQHPQIVGRDQEVRGKYLCNFQVLEEFLDARLTALEYILERSDDEYIVLSGRHGRPVQQGSHEKKVDQQLDE